MLDRLKEAISPEVREGEPMSRHTTYRIGGPAEFFFEARSSKDAVRAVQTARELGLPYFVFGGGSNILVADGGVKGLVVKMLNNGIDIQDTRVAAESGASSGLVAVKATEAGLTGLEWAAGLPGTIGGAIRGNAGAHGGEMKDSVAAVLVLRDGIEVTMSPDDCRFGYRDSVFKREPYWVILSAVLQLERSVDPEAGRELHRQNLERRNRTQPVDRPSSGCAFVNWRPNGQDEIDSLRRSLDLNKDEEIPFTPLGTVPAGWIIDRAQLKGMKVGHAMVSEKHGNFIVHDGEATADDIIALLGAVKMRIRNMTNSVVQLQEEVEYVGF